MALLPASHYNHCCITSTSLLQPPGGITPHSLAPCSVVFFIQAYVYGILPIGIQVSIF